MANQISKRDLLLLLGIVPAARTAGTYLSWRDDNSTGLDDVLAEMCRLNAALLETYLMTGGITPELAAKLPPDLAAKL